MQNCLLRALGLGFVFGLLAVGPFLLALAIVSAVRTEIFLHGCVAAEGAVLGLETMHTSHGSNGYSPIFRFTADDGQMHIIVSKVATSPPTFKRGDKVRVMYPPGHPESARIDSYSQLWMFPGAATIIGGVLTWVSVVLVLRRRRQIVANPQL
jgi:hypothetical protein